MNTFWSNNFISKENKAFIRCEKCKKETRIYFPDKAELLLCPGCQCIYSKTNGNYNKIAKNKKAPFNPTIPYGSVAIINDKEYTLISVAYKHEKGDRSAKWEEYTLIDKDCGYIYLSQSFGHWLMLREVSAPADFNKDLKEYEREDSHTYSLYSSYYQVTITGIGEFHDDVIATKSKFTREYISPPKIFTYEEDGNNRVFFEGEYLKPGKVAGLFKDSALALPLRDGVGSCQPFYFGINPMRFIKLSIIFIVFFVPILLLLLPPDSKDPLIEIESTLTDSLRNQQLVSKTFRLDNNLPELLRFESFGSVDNDWIENEITLVNETTGEERTFTDGIEYYHGFEDGESWSEGDVRKTHYLSSVDPGYYHLEANVLGSSSNKYTNYRLSVFKDSPTMFNFLLLMGSLLGLCVILYYANNKFENIRRGLYE